MQLGQDLGHVYTTLFDDCFRVVAAKLKGNPLGRGGRSKRTELSDLEYMWQFGALRVLRVPY